MEQTSPSGSWPSEVTVTRDDVDEYLDSVGDAKRVQKSYYISEPVAAQVAAAVHWGPVYALTHQRMTGEEVNLERIPDTISAFVERAVAQAVLQMQREYNDGEPFPPAGRAKSGPGLRGMERLSRPRGKRQQRQPDEES